MSLERLSLCTSNSRKLKPDVRKSIKFRGKGRSLRAVRRRCNPVLMMITVRQSFRRLGVSDFGSQTFLLFQCPSDSITEFIGKSFVNQSGEIHENYRDLTRALGWADGSSPVDMTEVPVLNIIASHLQLILSDKAKRDQK